MELPQYIENHWVLSQNYDVLSLFQNFGLLKHEKLIDLKHIFLKLEF